MPKNTPPRRIDLRPVATTGIVVSTGVGGGGGASDFADLTGTATTTQVPWAALKTTSLTAGAGLTGGGDLSTSRTFAVGAGDGISVGADTVGVDSTVVRTSRTLTAGAGLTGGGDLSANRTFSLTTPGGLSVSSTNSESGNHTHAITASADVGTTPAAALLKSTASGGLTLGALEVKGSASITGGGDFNVGTVFNVNTAGTRVGINMAADPQFSLDVAGALRASYLVGPHAIQLDDATFIAHYDGPNPPLTNPYGEPNGHKGQVAALTGQVYYLPGKFGKAVCIGSGATNVLVNPSFEVNVTDGWTLAGAGGRYRTGIRSQAGLYSGYLNSGVGSETTLRSVAALSVATGQSVSGQVMAYRSTAISGGLRLVTSSGTVLASQALAATGAWELLTATWTNGGGTVNVYLELYNGDTTGGLNVFFDCAQLEAGTFPTAYVDGTLGTWSGTAHNSTSTRTASALAYATNGNLPERTGTIMAWVNGTAGSGYQSILRATGTGAGYIILRYNGTTLEGYWGTAAVTATNQFVKGVWQHVAMTYDGTTLTLYVNGISVASGASSGFSGMPSTFYVGRADSAAQWFDGLLDDLVIVESALTATEVRAIYESNAPIFAESSVFHFRASPTGLVYADEEGLWVKASNGTAVLGVYAAAASKSWGGQTLETGDVLIGRGSNYMLWDDSAGTLKFAGNGSELTSINGGNIQTGTVTATQINVTDLAAIKTNTGTINVNTLATIAGGGAFAVLDGSGTQVGGMAGVGSYDTILWAGATYANRTSASFRVTTNGNISAAGVLAVDGISPYTANGPITFNGLRTVISGSGDTWAANIGTTERNTTRVAFLKGASADASEIDFYVNDVQQVRIQKGYTRIQGTVIGGVDSSGSSDTAYVYATGKSATPALKQDNSGATILDAASASTGVTLRHGGTNALALDQTVVRLPSSHILKLDEGTQLVGKADSTHTLTQQNQCGIYMKDDKLIVAFRTGSGSNDYAYFTLNLAATSNQSWIYTTTRP